MINSIYVFGLRLRHAQQDMAFTVTRSGYFFSSSELLGMTEIKRCRSERDFITRINLYTYFKISRRSNNLSQNGTR